MRANGLEIQTLEVDGQSASGGSNPNLLINGGFDVWQRGSTHTGASGVYGSADRWGVVQSGMAMSLTKATFTVGQTDVPGNPRKYAVCDCNATAGASDFVKFLQKIEGVKTSADETVTLIFWAKATSTDDIGFELTQNFGSGGSASVTGIGGQKVTLTTSWVLYTMTIDIPSISGKTIGVNNALQVQFYLNAGTDFDARLDSLGISGSKTVSFANVKVETGSTASLFVRRHEAEELTLCQRYYQTGFGIWCGDVTNTGVYYQDTMFPVTMRASPTATVGFVSANGFAQSVPTVDGVTNSQRLRVNKTSPWSGESGFYNYTWTADAEL